MRKLENRVLIAGVMLSLGITAVLWALKQDTLLTILIGLATAAITFLMEISIKLRGLHADTVKLLGFSERLNQDVWISEAVRSITHNYFQVLEEVNEPLFQARIKDVIREARDKTAMLASGRLELSSDEDPSYSLMVWERVKGSEDSVLAVSYNKNRNWWRSGAQKAYLKRNIDLAQRGANIRRILVLQRKDVAGMEDVVREMKRAGIECFVAIEEEIPAKFVGGYVVINGRIAKTWRTTATGRGQGGEVIVDPTIISTLERDFEQLCFHARPALLVYGQDQPPMPAREVQGQNQPPQSSN